MTPARLALLALAVASVCASEFSSAGVWGLEPQLGLSGDYSSNPALLNAAGTAESHAALLLDAPTTYVADAFKFSVLPRLRLSNARGYSSLDSDYERVDARTEFDTELSVWSASAGVARESSLYRDYLTNGAAGVRRDTGSADLNWDRHLDERTEFTTDLNAQRVRYAAPVGTGALTDYRYASLNPGFTWARSARTKFSATAGAGRYDSLDRRTESRSSYAQIGVTHALDARWSATVTAGYSRALNSLALFGRRFESTQNGTVFSAALTRSAERSSLTVDASRQLSPSGFAYLTRQDTYEIKADHAASERWTLSGAARRTSYRNPIVGGASYALDITTVDLSAAYLWSRRWTATLSASRILEHAGTPAIAIAANSVSLLLSRKFDWTTLQ